MARSSTTLQNPLGSFVDHVPLVGDDPLPNALGTQIALNPAKGPDMHVSPWDSVRSSRSPTRRRTSAAMPSASCTARRPSSTRRQATTSARTDGRVLSCPRAARHVPARSDEVDDEVGDGQRCSGCGRRRVADAEHGADAAEPEVLDERAVRIHRLGPDARESGLDIGMVGMLRTRSTNALTASEPTTSCTPVRSRGASKTLGGEELAPRRGRRRGDGSPLERSRVEAPGVRAEQHAAVDPSGARNGYRGSGTG